MSDTQRIDADDPRLTAYALGELPKEERATFEALLRRDGGLLKQVAEVQRLANLIEEDLKADADAAKVEPLSPAQRATVEAAAKPAPRGKVAPAGEVLKLPAPAPRPLLVRLLPFAAAAGLLVVVGGLATMSLHAAKRADRMLAASSPPLPAATTTAASGDRHFTTNETGVVYYDAPAFCTEAAPPGLPPPVGKGEDDLAAAASAQTAGDLQARARELREAKNQLQDQDAEEQLDALRLARRSSHDAPGPAASTPAEGQGHEDGTALRLRRAQEEARAEAETRERLRREQERLGENAFKRATGDDVRSTFAIDVDTASYANVRRFLQHHQLPDADAVRLEEMINYFPYEYAPPTGEDPFAAHVEVTGCPWRQGHRLVRVGLKGRELDAARRPASNLVFLIDVSGSMDEPQKLPLVKAGLRQLVTQLGERDRVAIVVYAGASGLVLPSTSGDRGEEILGALDRLQGGGSTNGGAGIELAYRVAIENFKDGGVNRVILCSDGDFNVGVTRRDELERLIEQKARSNVFLTVLGFGQSYSDATCERLADRGNGNYAVIDSLREAKKVLVEQAAGTLVTIAKDVKVQVEWNPRTVASYRLIGYENRVMANADFRDDARDAGEIGAGHTVTALYEVEPQRDAPAGETLVTVRLRYKQPEGDVAKELAFPVRDGGGSFDAASEDTRFAASVAGFGMLLRRSQHAGQASWALVRELARGAIGKDPGGHRSEMLELIDRAAGLDRR